MLSLLTKQTGKTIRNKTFTTFDISKILEVHPSTVSRWINEGKLKAFNTPGSHKRVSDKNLLEFLKKYDMPIPDSLNHEKKILVVDDDEVVSKLIKKILEGRRKYKVFIAKDGFQAGEAVSDFEPGLVILDIMLPGINGYDVCKMIKEKHKKIKILGITGYDTEENIRKMLASGADDLMVKPVVTSELVKKVGSFFK
ncbi:MAG: response regulator [Candidatus Wallbacteria bacterium]|nr:response regulator [Candidatus Wallbacteria bacterium]